MFERNSAARKATEPTLGMVTGLKSVSKEPEKPQIRPDWRGLLSTVGELAGIGAISAGAAWYSLGAGAIVGGVGILVVSIAAGLTEPVGVRRDGGKPESR